MKVANAEMSSIEYRLNILGIRVTERDGQLIAKSSDEWSPIGQRLQLPLPVPRTSEDLKEAADSPLKLTAYQFNAENPDTDIIEVLEQTKDLKTAIAATLAAAAESKV